MSATEPRNDAVARTRFVWQPVLGGGAEIAVVPLLGAIRPGAGEPSGLVGVLRALGERDQVRAVVLRIDSPGGEPLASDLIWRAVRVLAGKKPVIASLAETAASGGYYVAMAAHEVVADPCSLTGSIGVVLAGLEIDGLLDSLGISLDGVQRGKHAGIHDLARRRTDEERAVPREQHIEHEVQGEEDGHDQADEQREGHGTEQPEENVLAAAADLLTGGDAGRPIDGQGHGGADRVGDRTCALEDGELGPEGADRVGRRLLGAGPEDLRHEEQRPYDCEDQQDHQRHSASAFLPGTYRESAPGRWMGGTWPAPTGCVPAT